VLALVEQLPAGQRFETVHDAWEALARLDPTWAVEFEQRSVRRRRGRD
jgi:hypothetical protein